MSVIERLNRDIHPVFDRTDEIYVAMFGSEDSEPLAVIDSSEDVNCGAICNELEFVKKSASYFSHAVLAHAAEGEERDRAINALVALPRRGQIEDDETFLSRFRSLLVAQGFPRRVTRGAIRHALSHLGTLTVGRVRLWEQFDDNVQPQIEIRLDGAGTGDPVVLGQSYLGGQFYMGGFGVGALVAYLSSIISRIRAAGVRAIARFVRGFGTLTAPSQSTVLHWPEDPVAYWPMNDSIPLYPDDATEALGLNDGTELGGWTHELNQHAHSFLETPNRWRIERTVSGDSPTLASCIIAIPAGSYFSFGFYETSLSENLRVQYTIPIVSTHVDLYDGPPTAGIYRFVLPADASRVRIWSSGGEIGDYMELTFAYVGNGAFSTKLLDTAGGSDADLVGFLDSASGPVDGAIEFVDGYMLPGSVLDVVDNSFTMSLQVFWDGTVGTAMQLVANTLDLSGDNCFSMHLSASGAPSVFTRDDEDASFAAADPIPTNTWTPLAFRRIGDVGEIYVDGVLAATGTVREGDIGNASDWIVGNKIDRTEPMHGRIAELALYERALSVAEIENLATHIRKPTGE